MLLIYVELVDAREFAFFEWPLSNLVGWSRSSAGRGARINARLGGAGRRRLAHN